LPPCAVIFPMPETSSSDTMGSGPICAAPERAPQAPRQTPLYYDFEIRTCTATWAASMARKNPLVACAVEQETILLVPPGTKCALARAAKGLLERSASPCGSPPHPSTPLPEPQALFFDPRQALSHRFGKISADFFRNLCYAPPRASKRFAIKR
jgi:hypothetical protein